MLADYGAEGGKSLDISFPVREFRRFVEESPSYHQDTMAVRVVHTRKYVNLSYCSTSANRTSYSLPDDVFQKGEMKPAKASRPKDKKDNKKKKNAGTAKTGKRQFADTGLEVRNVHITREPTHCFNRPEGRFQAPWLTVGANIGQREAYKEKSFRSQRHSRSDPSLNSHSPWWAHAQDMSYFPPQKFYGHYGHHELFGHYGHFGPLAAHFSDTKLQIQLPTHQHSLHFQPQPHYVTARSRVSSARPP